MRYLFLFLIPLIVFSANLQKGWNLVGSKGELNAYSDLIMSDASKVESIWLYKSNDWKVFRPTQTPPNIGDSFKISSQDGFWVNSLVDLNNVWEDTNINQSNILNVTRGWNLLSSPNDSNLNLKDLGAFSIFSYNKNSGSWLIYASTQKDMETLNANEGFWGFYESEKTIDIFNSTSTTTTSTTTLATSEDIFNSKGYTLIGWNDLGMHCVDGKDYSVFSILPPYNNLIVQLLKKDGTSNKHITSNVAITYEATNGLNGAINTTTSNKTNFWEYVQSLFNTYLANDVGLTGNKTPSLTPNKLTYNSSNNWWEATGIPIMNYDDNGEKNYYPMVKVVARDLSNNILATTKVVLPVSDEMDCKKCHSSSSSSEAKPSSGWANNSDSLKDFKLNILKLHDDKHSIDGYLSELKSKGYDYKSSLYESATNGTPILCASCHKSNALGTSGVANIKPLTQALHGLHSKVLDDVTNKDSCYSCHPGQSTKCLRGAMGNANINCQDCHGNMSALASTHRDGWLDEPNCQSCHQNGTRHTTAVTDIKTGTLREALDTKFATNSNTPVSGKSLYRFSTGHGDMQCSACHGSTHAIYPSSKDEDNVQNIALQGYKGTLSDCTACHTTMPYTASSGPHGMHSTNQDWVNKHEDIAEKSLENCKSCHGVDLKGSDLSKTFVDRTFSTKWGTKTFAKGSKIGCDSCHGGIVSGSTSTISSDMHATTQTWVDKHKRSAKNPESCKSCHGSDLRGSALSTTSSDRTFSTDWGTKKFPKGTQIGCYNCHNGPDDDDD